MVLLTVNLSFWACYRITYYRRFTSFVQMQSMRVSDTLLKNQKPNSTDNKRYLGTKRYDVSDILTSEIL